MLTALFCLDFPAAMYSWYLIVTEWRGSRKKEVVAQKKD
jgi:hypothetical protein